MNKNTIIELLKGDSLSEREKTFIIEYLKKLANNEHGLIDSLKAKALEFRKQPQIKSNIKLLDYEPVRRIPPMWEFVESKQYLGKTIGKIVYPRILDVLVAADDPTIREIYICAGKGVGKSTICGVMMARGAYILNSYPKIRDIFKVQEGTYIVVLNMSINATQAQKVIFQKFKSIIRNSPCFEGAIIGKREIEFRNEILGLSGHSDYQAFFGYDVFYGCIDEASHFDATKERNVAAEIYEGIVASQATRFINDSKLLIISTPLHEEDFLTQKVNEAKKNGTPVKIFTGDSASDIKQVSYESTGAWQGIEL